MPELPEVETIVRDLRLKILNRKIKAVAVYDSRIICQQPPRDFIRKLQGRRLSAISRRGKAIIAELDDQNYFVIQLMMTGQLIVSPTPQRTKATKVSFQLSNGRHLHYNDHRLFGRLRVVDDLRRISYFCKLGPEPLEAGFSIPWLEKKLRERRIPIKALLLDHTFVAGIGNIYASEILFQSRIHPQRPAHDLGAKDAERLHAATRKVLTEAIRWRGTSMNTYRDASGEEGRFLSRIKVYGREHQPCCRCRSLLLKIVQRGRSTFYCPTCQH